MKALLAAIAFLTRIPVPYHWYQDIDFACISRLFPLVGGLIGSVASMVLLATAPLFGQPIAATLTILSLLLLTGAFHQDGLADLCDGFWGGQTRERKLAIMKDSQIGTYGVLSLIGATLLASQCLAALPLAHAWAILIGAQGGSRMMSGYLPALLPYARQDGNSKTPQRLHRPDARHLLVLTGSGILTLLPLLYLAPALALATVLTMASALFVMARLQRRHLDGYTGDTLGATQQIAELVALLSAVAFFH
ncbi:adenosylcobinamide-GDP ribazoletransferase [Ferrimonas balearica]|uniref:adenosylcobinamide-GDP ribazoletransferase n=1 Tax=Ferrimonas balearica TaxID=44012 RepID=UPI001F407BA1|nr:adenosylcobinamide-GDP ribazoletransferase [Ferrimonas balearica]MBY6096788.1 adenosylcobinamide-GDP ribazoletransferase [Ferrimonas balearica]